MQVCLHSRCYVYFSFLTNSYIVLVVYVPDVFPFTKSVTECTCPSNNNLPDSFIGVEAALNTAQQNIMNKLSQVERTPPLMISRTSRGGKTTLLYLLFNQLKNNGMNPIFISFNEGYICRQELTQKEAILHLIATQLTDPDVINGRSIICDEGKLDEHLGNGPVILLIDELNALSYPINEEAGRMLKKLFLDKRNRYFVFSTHVPMDIDPLTSKYIESTSSSNRYCITLQFNPTSNFDLLRDLVSQSSSLTQTEAIIYGRIPSLIYIVKCTSSFDTYAHFKRFSSKFTFNEENFFHFLISVMKGTLNDNIHLYAQFGMVSKSEVIWPLCYIICFLQSFFAVLPEFRSAINGISQCYELLKSCASSNVDSGKDWESLINIAILIRCILSKSYPEYSPFNLFQEPISNVRFLSFDSEMKTLKAAKTFMNKTLNKLSASNKPAVLIAIPTSSTFEVVDGIIVHCTLDNTEYYGYQAKAGKSFPDTNKLIPDWMSECYLLRGKAPETTHGSAKEKKWKYCNKLSTIDLLGKSFAELCPAKLAELFPPLPSSSSSSTTTTTVPPSSTTTTTRKRKAVQKTTTLEEEEEQH